MATHVQYCNTNMLTILLANIKQRKGDMHERNKKTLMAAIDYPKNTSFTASKVFKNCY